jgi:hypothetical protein
VDELAPSDSEIEMSQAQLSWKEKTMICL